MSLGEGLRTPAGVRWLSYEELDELAAEIRKFIVEAVSVTGGHLGCNLAVGLTLAIYRLFESPRDVLLWDTGHQACVHKLVTGRDTGHQACVHKLVTGRDTGHQACVHKLVTGRDTGHQACVHKLVTGRHERFGTLSRRDRLSGHPSRRKSVRDRLENSHVPTVLLYDHGIAPAVRHEDVAVIGDGSLTAAMACETKPQV